MCLGIPGRVIEMATDRPDVAVVDVSGARRRVSLALLDDVAVGDWVLIHVGFAMALIDEAEATAALLLLAQLGEGVDDILGPADSAVSPSSSTGADHRLPTSVPPADGPAGASA